MLDFLSYLLASWIILAHLWALVDMRKYVVAEAQKDFDKWKANR